MTLPVADTGCSLFLFFFQIGDTVAPSAEWLMHMTYFKRISAKPVISNLLFLNN